MPPRKSGPRPMSATAAQSSTGSAAALEVAPTVPEPAPSSQPATRRSPASSGTTVKTTVLLPGSTDHQLDDLTRELGDVLGRVAGARGGRYPARSDVIKALIHLAAEEAELRRRMIRQVEFDLTGR